MSSDSRQLQSVSRRRVLTGLLCSFTVGLPSGSSLAQHPLQSEIKALTFDVFGTVVDWRGSIIQEGEMLSARRGLSVNWGEFADRWRSGYGPAMARVRSGELPWTKIDDLHRLILESLLPEFGLEFLEEAERVHLNRVWHRLSPWPDSVGGLNRLKSRYIIATLSNGNVSLLTQMAKNAGLPWDAVLSAELARHYKPDPEAYLMAAELLSLEPAEVLMVAAHPSDLRAAARTGMKTAYVPRPLERGTEADFEPAPAADFDIVAADFIELARLLGA